jgi:hypothetical protein
VEVDITLGIQTFLLQSFELGFVTLQSTLCTGSPYLMELSAVCLDRTANLLKKEGTSTTFDTTQDP